MGWSCTQAAGRVMEYWTKTCIANSGKQNEWKEKNNIYFWEIGRENRDGAITGTIVKVFNMRPDGSSQCRVCGSFRINPDGTIKRAPTFLRMISFLGHAELS